ncbi:hypothetical protein B9Z55_010975 [Caenorhabditis nigoni]|uniref:F-box domain-containing protein n=1 Tax=Caenorhabditis nigoni TaxID=1611254 RepID=A0A2G5UJ33_9PELO|nr:hypothetical protein B9Z55_010975 [Caenorhabditis nigoni]
MSTPSDFVPKEGEKKHENERVTNRFANKSDIISLIKFIGGFEKWNDLNDDCRMAVVKFLEYKDRCKLGICSKRDYDTV